MVEYTADHFRRGRGRPPARRPGAALDAGQDFPVDIAGIPIVYGLAFGCTAVWKPSELAPLRAELFVDVLHEAGFPRGP